MTAVEQTPAEKVRQLTERIIGGDADAVAELCWVILDERDPARRMALTLEGMRTALPYLET